MIYAIPALDGVDEHVLGQIEDLRGRLRYSLAEPRRWYGSLRRATMARSVRGSNSIEGYNSSEEDAAAIIDGEAPFEADPETRQAIAGYRDAMTYVLQAAPARVDVSMLKALHFMMLKHDLSVHPGRWRPGAVWVSDPEGNTVYDAPHRDEIDRLIDEMLAQIAGSTAPPMVTAAMAHLNLALIHPFSDGNGRMARCLQTLVLASDGVLSPVFSSIEEYLGHHTEAYYQALTETAAGAWSPGRDARPWMEFCLTAHVRQAFLLRRRIQEIEALWDVCEQLAATHRLPARTVGPLTDSARGWRLTRSLYISAVESSTGDRINAPTATRDLSAMAAAGLLSPVGEKRGRYYRPGRELRDRWRQIRAMRPRQGLVDPYETARTAVSGIGTR